MGVVVIRNQVTEADLAIAKQEYGDFIKIVVDIRTELVTIGGEWHSDGESELLTLGSNQADLWGGGVDVATHNISYSAMTNVKPGINLQHIILDAKTREVFDKIVKEKFDYV